MPTSTKKPRGRPKKIKPVEKTEYFLELEIDGRLYFGDGLSMLEALKNLEQPPKIVSKGILRIQAGQKRKQLNMVIPQMKRLFFPLAHITVAKQLELLAK